MPHQEWQRRCHFVSPKCRYARVIFTVLVDMIICLVLKGMQFISPTNLKTFGLLLEGLEAFELRWAGLLSSIHKSSSSQLMGLDPKVFYWKGHEPFTGNRFLLCSKSYSVLTVLSIFSKYIFTLELLFGLDIFTSTWVKIFYCNATLKSFLSNFLSTFPTSEILGKQVGHSLSS